MLEIVDETGSPARLKVIGVGGGGSNAVNRMIEAGLRDVEFWVANTDKQALDRSPCLHRLQIGRATTRGLGAGGDPEIGRLSAEEDQEAIEKIVSGADMVFITAGMGGGTGTGAAPVLARYAREMGVLTVGIVTKPFSFEGRKKMGRAMNGLDALSEHVDTLIAIPNQKLMHIVEPGTSFSDALLMADEVLFQATRGISDLIMGHGIINLDFADVRTVMRDRGNALLGSGTASGKDRAVEAAQAAVSSPLLEEISIEGAEALLVNIQGGTSMSFHEAAEAAQFIADRVGDEADVFWGAVVDPAMDEEVRVTLIATGFPGARRLGEANQVLSGAAPASRATVAGREARGGDLRKIAHRRGAERYESIEINLASGPASSREEGHAHPTDPERPAVADRSVAAGGSAITRRSSVADGPNESLGFVGGRGERSPERDGRPLMDRESNRGHEAALGGRSEPNLGSSAHPGGAPRKPEEPDGERSSRADESRRGPDVERGHDAESGQPAGRGREAARTPERVQEAARGQETDREDRRGQVPGRAPAGAPDRVRPAQVEPVHAAESARRRIEELVPLRGADEGLRGGRGYDSSWNREQQEKRKNGNRREERGSHRNPLDVPTYLRKPVDD